MTVAEHVGKASRLEASLGKLRADEDGEGVIWGCMQAGTHRVNAALHEAWPDFSDLEHSDLVGLSPTDPDRLVRPRWPTELPVNLRRALDQLAAIEALRPVYVRGPQIDEAGARVALRHYASLKRELGPELGPDSAERPARGFPG